MPFFFVLSASPRNPLPFMAQLRAIDATIDEQHDPDAQAFRLTKATVWTPAQMAAVESILNATDPAAEHAAAQGIIDAMPLWEKAAFLLVLDRFNLIAPRVSPPLAQVTPAQFLQAIRDKVATL